MRICYYCNKPVHRIGLEERDIHFMCLDLLVREFRQPITHRPLTDKDIVYARFISVCD